jgi:phage host-nuclease inhibitor protein Gam
MDKAELVITALQQRIGELTANYETQIAILRAEITIMANEQEEKKKAADEYSQSLSDKTSNL